jgi:hypothetical protein
MPRVPKPDLGAEADHADQHRHDDAADDEIAAGFVVMEAA